MSKRSRFILRTTLGALAAIGLLSGCAAFTGSRKVDVSPFSENTVGMLDGMLTSLGFQHVTVTFGGTPAT